MEEWKEYKLSDFMEFNPKISLKKDVIARKITMDQLIPYSRDIYFWTYEPYSGGAKFQNGDTIMARITPCLENGKHAYISLLDENETAFGSTEYIVMRGKKGISDNKFVYYLTHYPSFKNSAIKSMVGSSGRQRAQVVVLENLTMHLPLLSEQIRIADMLSELDDKIAVNRRICENLEAQAQALFKHLFIDFAPFKNGNFCTNREQNETCFNSAEVQPKITGKACKFVESELGMIPEGWRVGTYSDIIQETISGDWGKEKTEGNYTHKVACIRGCDFQDVKMGLRGKTPERFILEKNYQTKHFEDKDVLVEISGGTATVSTGRICPVSQLLIDKYEGDIVCTNFCRLVRPIKGYSSYLYYSWKYKYDHKVMFGYENGTSGIKNFSIKDFSSREPLILPELSALNEFENIIDHIHTQIQNCGSESAKLATLRDTLLPKLMSGQIKV